MIRTSRLELRPCTEEDVPAVAAFYRDNEEHLRPWSPARPADFTTEAYWRAQVPRLEAEWKAGRNLRLYAHPLEASSPLVIGSASLSQIARGGQQQCYLGYDLAADWQGRGYAREMVRAVVDFAFGELRLHRVAAQYMPHNHPSARLLRDLGFQIEGYARGYLAIAGRWEDHVMTALVNPDRPPGE